MKPSLLFLTVLVLAACGKLPGTPTVLPDAGVTGLPGEGSPTVEPGLNPFASRPGDEQLTRGKAFVSEAGLLVRESFPPQIVLSISGELPTPCHQLRVTVAAPDPEKKIRVEVYSVVNPDLACTQVLRPFSEQLNLGSFPGGHYSVWVDGTLAGEFDS